MQLSPAPARGRGRRQAELGARRRQASVLGVCGLWCPCQDDDKAKNLPQKKPWIGASSALVYSKSEEEHVRHIRQICETLVQHRLYLNIDKCQFFKPEVCYLGQIIGRWGTRPTDDRAQAIQDWPELTNVGEVRSFLGLCGFVRRWIQDFAQIAAPLHALLKKGQSWSWGTAEQEAFEELKIRCSAHPVQYVTAEWEPR